MSVEFQRLPPPSGCLEIHTPAELLAPCSVFCLRRKPDISPLSFTREQRCCAALFAINAWFPILLPSFRVVPASAPRPAATDPQTLPPPGPAPQRGEVRSNGPEAGPVGPDGRRGGARPEGGAARHEAAQEGGGQAEVREAPAAAAATAGLWHFARADGSDEK